MRRGIFSCPSGAKVSWSRAPPPKVTTTTFRFFTGILVWDSRLDAISPLPNERPAAARKNSRRVKARCRAGSWGLQALEVHRVMGGEIEEFIANRRRFRFQTGV